MTHLPQWAFSALKRPIELYHSDDFTWNHLARPLLFIGGVHGDEPEGVALANGLLEWLKNNENSYPVKIKQRWVLIPCINPDGYALNQRVNGNGVDLNRNFPSKNWSAKHNNPRYNPGRSPGSESEIKALINLIEQLDPQLIIHFHSWKPCIVCTGKPGERDAYRLAESSGYEVVTSIGYPTPGSLSQYGWHDHNIPILCVEEQEHTNPAQVWPRFCQAFENILGDETPRT